MVVAHERNMDFMQGLLVYLQWPYCQHTGSKEKPFLALWTNLIIALAQDLGFMTTRGESALTYFKAFWMPKTVTNGPNLCNPTTEHSMEARRVVLSLFIWSTV